MSKTPFPKGFLWGSATSSYQVEGGIENCDWAKAGKEKRVPVCDTACEHYTRYEDDFDIAQSLGHNAHRLSIEWSRIESEENVYNEKEIEHYRQVLRALHARNITPLVTLWHFTVPVWLSAKGGWEQKDASKKFARYCRHVVQELGDLCDNYATINEPMVVAGIGYIHGTWPPFYKKSLVRYLKVLTHMAKGHNLAYKLIKELSANKEVGIVKHTVAFSSNKNPFNILLAIFSNFAWTHIFMLSVYRKCDWIGVNYYQRKIFGDTRELQKTDMGWGIDPAGIYDALNILKVYKKPMYISEAGCADALDRFRADYIRDTVGALERAVQEGIDLRGYCYWSLLDNYEWAEGFSKRFGLVAVDYETQKRTIRPSAYVYRDLIQSHSVSNE